MRHKVPNFKCNFPTLVSMAWLVGVSSWTPKGCEFDSGQDIFLGRGFHPLVRGMQEAANGSIFFASLSLPPPAPPPPPPTLWRLMGYGTASLFCHMHSLPHVLEISSTSVFSAASPAPPPHQMLMLFKHYFIVIRVESWEEHVITPSLNEHIIAVQTMWE